MKPITSRALLSLQFIGNPQYSPDGKCLVYVQTSINEEGNTYQSRLRLVDTETREDRVLTNGRGQKGVASDHSPRFSPDGGHIAFLSNRSGKNQVYVMSMDGGEPVQATSFGKGVKGFNWSFDGEMLVVSARPDDPEGKSDVRVIKSLRHKMNGEGFFGDEPIHLWWVSRDGTKIRQLTSGPYDEQEAVCSPDGKSIAFVSWRKEDQREVVPSLYTLSIESGAMKCVYEGKGTTASPVYSPDGQWIAFIAHTSGETSGANPHVWIIPADGGDAKDLISGFDRPVGNCIGSDARYETAGAGPIWSSDSRRIFFQATDGGTCQVYSVSLEGELRCETEREAQVVTSFAIHNGKVAYPCETSTRPAEIMIRDGSQTEQVTWHNESWLSGFSVSKPERMTFQAHDGLPLEGWMMKPPSFNSSNRYPVVLEVHGGPHVAYGETFVHEFQMLAARGYIVLYINPRGSHGYGESFVRACIGDWGGNDYRDLMAAVDSVTELPYVDSSRLFVTGGSYGGYMTNWIVTQTSRFRAAVTQRSVCNLYSKIGTSDNGFYTNAGELGDANLWDDEEFIMQRSPIRHARNVRTPIKIIHGEADLRCPMEQAEQWFTALQLLGVETELVRFPGEHHGLSQRGKPKHRIERLDHIVDWFDRYSRMEMPEATL